MAAATKSSSGFPGLTVGTDAIAHLAFSSLAKSVSASSEHEENIELFSKDLDSEYIKAADLLRPDDKRTLELDVPRCGWSNVPQAPLDTHSIVVEPIKVLKLFIAKVAVQSGAGYFQGINISVAMLLQHTLFPNLAGPPISINSTAIRRFLACLEVLQDVIRFKISILVPHCSDSAAGGSDDEKAITTLID